VNKLQIIWVIFYIVLLVYLGLVIGAILFDDVILKACAIIFVVAFAIQYSMLVKKIIPRQG
jgi:hypothetical protein